MTVAELTTILTTMPQNAPVLINTHADSHSARLDHIQHITTWPPESGLIQAVTIR